MITAGIKSLVLFSICVYFLNACSYDKEDVLYKNYLDIKCDTTNITYSKTVVHILSANCYICHSTQVATSGIIVDNYNDVIKNINLIRPAINHQPGLTPMPKDMSKLPDCDLLQIQIWIDKGTPNN